MKFKYLINFTRFWLIAYLYLLMVPVLAKPQITIVYPNNNSIIASQSTYFVGNTTPGSSLFINKKPINLEKGGIFVKNVDLKPGINIFNLESINKNESSTQKIAIKVPYAGKQLPKQPLTIDSKTITPSGLNIYSCDDIINVSFKGSPGGKASFSIGDKIKCPMSELPPQINTINQIALGEYSGIKQLPLSGIYNGIYKLSSNDNLNNSTIKVSLSDGKGKTITKQSSAKITAWNIFKTPRVGEITVDKAVIRTGPTESRLTPLSKGTKILLTGFNKGSYKFQMGMLRDGYISEKQLKLLPVGTPVPYSIVKTVNVKKIKNDSYIYIPLSTKLPYLVEQSVDQQKLSLYIYGAKADTDTIRYDANDDYIQQVKWSQPYKNVYLLEILLKNPKQWGYNLFYIGQENKGNLKLIFKIKHPPKIINNNPLMNRIIAIDPGHGGSEKGSVGPGLVPEKDINLKISKLLADLLKAKGAVPLLTRNNDVDLSLRARTDFAEANNADILISIHNNALPDGRNPLIEHGSSTYYYHPMALMLAKGIQQELLYNLKLPDFGIYYDNLAITREYNMPSVLVEIAFMVNPVEYIKLNDITFQQASAKAILKGIENYFSNKT